MAATRGCGAGRWPPGLLPGLSLLLALLLGACAHSHGDPAVDAEINIAPANYKADILGAMRAYLNDPTGVRDAGISEPAIKTVSNLQRYVVCVRFNAKKPQGKGYAGPKELAAVFMVGKFDHFAEKPHAEKSEKSDAEKPSSDKANDPCAGAAYTPFPELEKLPR